MEIRIIPAYLGWSNPGTGPENMRLFACDKQQPTAPRWDGEHGRVIEQAIREQNVATEGGRFVLVYVGDRFTTDLIVDEATDAIRRALSGEPSGD